MNAKELRQMNEKDLENKLIETRRELMKLNTQVASGTTPKNPGQLKKYKKIIAKVLMVIGEKQKAK